jgi:hypothetical protein
LKALREYSRTLEKQEEKRRYEIEERERKTLERMSKMADTVV